MPTFLTRIPASKKPDSWGNRTRMRKLLNGQDPKEKKRVWIRVRLSFKVSHLPVEHLLTGVRPMQFHILRLPLKLPAHLDRPRNIYKNRLTPKLTSSNTGSSFTGAAATSSFFLSPSRFSANISSASSSSTLSGTVAFLPTLTWIFQDNSKGWGLSAKLGKHSAKFPPNRTMFP